MAFRVAAVAFILTTYYFLRAHSKVYHRCELAYELRDVHEIPEQQLATWVCIANYESHFNTSAHNPGSGDHGLFQISELYWCSPPGGGFACGLPCSAFKDDDIEDDVICARRIYREHRRLSGDGFTAWVVYNLYCKNPAHVNSFIEGCFDQENLVKYPYNKYQYDYQPIYEAMNLPTVIVPMTTVPSLMPETQTEMSTLTSPSTNLTTEKPMLTKQEKKSITMMLTSTTSPTMTTAKPSPSSKPTKSKQPPKIMTTRPSIQLVKSTLKPASKSTTRAKSSTFTSYKSTTMKPKLFTYKPTARSIRLTTPRRINPFDSTKRPIHIYTTTKPTVYASMSSGIPSLSTAIVTPTIPRKHTDNAKSMFVKPRETKTFKYKPFEFKKNEVVYAVVNKPDYSFAISSNGFKFVRTVR